MFDVHARETTPREAAIGSRLWALRHLRMGGDFCIYVQLIKINGKKKEWEEMRGLG